VSLLDRLAEGPVPGVLTALMMTGWLIVMLRRRR